MAKVVTMTNNKGGVGKTTSVTNIALGLIWILKQGGVSNNKVLVIDTDSQAHSTLLLTGQDEYGIDDSLIAVLRAKREDAPNVLRRNIIASEWDDNLYILPGSKLLDDEERNQIGVSGAIYKLDDALQSVGDEYAAIIIDTRPSFTLLTEMALVASTDAIVPVEPRYLESKGLTNVVAKVNDIRKAWRISNLRVSGIILTKFDGRISGHIQTHDELAAHPALGKLLMGVVPVNEAISYAHAQHLSIYEYDARSAAAQAYASISNQIARSLFSKA